MLPVHGLIIVELLPKINCNSTINLTKIRPLILWDLPKTLIAAWSSAIILRTDLQKFLVSIFKALLIGKPALQSHITGHARRLPSTSASRSRSWPGYPPPTHAAVPLSAANKKPHLFRCGFFLRSARLQFSGMPFAGIVLPRPQTHSYKMPAPRNCDAVHRTPRCTGLPLVVTQKIGSMR